MSFTPKKMEFARLCLGQVSVFTKNRKFKIFRKKHHFGVKSNFSEIPIFLESSRLTMFTLLTLW